MMSDGSDKPTFSVSLALCDFLSCTSSKAASLSFLFISILVMQVFFVLAGPSRPMSRRFLQALSSSV